MPAPWSSFLERFLRRAAERPEAIALVSAGAPPLRYRDLVDEVQRLAAALHARRVGPEAVVALGVGRSREFVIGVLAAWWAGAAFVPIDPALPPARRAALAAESGARVMVTTPGQRECFYGLDIPILVIGSESPCGRVAAAEPRPDDLAYLIFTSGSTGQPKGVLVEQRGLVAVLDAQITAFDLRPGDRALWMLSPSFDASLSDVGTALLAGATLMVAPPEARDPEALVKSLTDHAITHVDLPPALLPLLDPGRAPASLRTVVIGGEVCPPEAVRRWARTRRVVNVYGPTEATICASLCVCDPERWEEPLLGRPFGDIAITSWTSVYGRRRRGRSASCVSKARAWRAATSAGGTSPWPSSPSSRANVSTAPATACAAAPTASTCFTAGSTGRSSSAASSSSRRRSRRA